MRPRQTGKIQVHGLAILQLKERSITKRVGHGLNPKCAEHFGGDGIRECMRRWRRIGSRDQRVQKGNVLDASASIRGDDLGGWRHKQAPVVVVQSPKPADRRPRPQRWHDAVTELLALQAAYAAWFEALPESLRGTATADALEAIAELDLDALAAITPPRGYGRD
jgi:hypothetical protein